MMTVYVKIKFRPVGGRARWYWAKKLAPGRYLRVAEDGDPWRELADREIKEILVGEPEVELPAVMNNHYGLLEVTKGSV